MDGSNWFSRFLLLIVCEESWDLPSHDCDECKTKIAKGEQILNHSLKKNGKQSQTLIIVPNIWNLVIKNSA